MSEKSDFQGRFGLGYLTPKEPPISEELKLLREISLALIDVVARLEVLEEKVDNLNLAPQTEWGLDA